MEEKEKNNVTQTILITKSDREKLRHLAREGDVSMSHIVRKLVRKEWEGEEE